MVDFVNHLYSEQGRVSANGMAQKVEALFEKDKKLSRYYHDSVANGKWNHMMSQTHISYDNWQQPRKDVVPELKRVIPVSGAEMGVAVEGDSAWWPNASKAAELPEMDVYKQEERYIEIFNRGKSPFEYKVETERNWISLSNSSGNISDQERILISVDWDEVPYGYHEAPITIFGPNDTSVQVIVKVRNPESPKREAVNGYMESNGYISMDATKFTEKVETDEIEWKVIPDLGRTGSAITTFPVNSAPVELTSTSPRLDYKINILEAGKITVLVYVSPTLNIYSDEGLEYGISIGDEKPKIQSIHQGDTIPEWYYPNWWNNAVSQNIKILVSEHEVSLPGEYTLSYWMKDPAIVLQKIVIVRNEIRNSYLGPPESFNQKNK